MSVQAVAFGADRNRVLTGSTDQTAATLIRRS
jgi:hypothetical protein